MVKPKSVVEPKYVDLEEVVADLDLIKYTLKDHVVGWNIAHPAFDALIRLKRVSDTLNEIALKAKEEKKDA